MQKIFSTDSRPDTCGRNFQPTCE